MLVWSREEVMSDSLECGGGGLTDSLTDGEDAVTNVDGNGHITYN